MPAAKRLGRPRATELRAVLDATLYIARTGCQWRMLPKDFPPFTTVQGYFYDWRDNGLFGARSGGPRGEPVGRSDRQSIGQDDRKRRAAGLRCGQEDQRAQATYCDRYWRSAGRCRGTPRRYPREIATVPFWSSRRSASYFPGCAICSPTASTTAPTCVTPSPSSATGPSRSSNARLTRRAFSCCHADGLSSERLLGSIETAAWPRISRRRLRAPKRGSTSPLCSCSSGGWPDHHTTLRSIIQPIRLRFGHLDPPAGRPCGDRDADVQICHSPVTVADNTRLRIPFRRRRSAIGIEVCNRYSAFLTHNFAFRRIAKDFIGHEFLLLAHRSSHALWQLNIDHDHRFKSFNLSWKP